MRAYHQVLLWDIVGRQPMARFTKLFDRLANPFLGKSIVVYAQKPGRAVAANRRPPVTDFLRDVRGAVTAAELRQTVDAIAEWQLPSGMVPWFPGGHADPWNHVEAAMALALGGRRAEAERAYEWLVGLQRPDGAWHQYYVAGDRTAPRRSNRTSSTPTSAPTSPPASGTTCCSSTTTASPRRCGRWSRQAIDFVLELQTPRGEIRWARHADGTPWTFALLTGSSSICHSLRCAIALAERLGHERPDWELSAARLAHVIRAHCTPTRPTPSRRSTAGRWTGTTRSSAAFSAATRAASASPPASTGSSTTATA